MRATAVPKPANATLDELRAGISRLSEESAGLLRVHVVAPGDLPDLLAAAALGSPLAAVISTAVVNLVEKAIASPARRPALCATCERSIRRRPFAAAIVLPSSDQRTKALSMGICGQCADSPDKARVRACEVIEAIWPGARELPGVIHAAGHA